MLEQAFAKRLVERKAQHLYRQRLCLESPQAACVAVGDRLLTNFASSDYLGLANHPEVKQAFKEGVDQYGAGSGASQVVCGYSQAHRQLEQAIAKFTGRESALLFPTGYMANLGVASALAGKNDFILQDKLNHASLLDAAKLSAATQLRFLHTDPQSLQQRLNTTSEHFKLVITEGVFSMDGDEPPLSEYIQLLTEQNALLIVDDAHGFGVFGETGAGTLEKMHLTSQQVPLLVGTFSKALGSLGAFVAGSQTLIDCITQFARSCIYTTALPPAIACANLAALELVKQGSERQRLNQLIDYFKDKANQHGLQLLASQTAIQPIVLGQTDYALTVYEKLLEKEFLVGLMRPPSVAKNSSRLRIALSANHNQQQIDKLLATLVSILKA